MDERDFYYWLRGFFELSDAKTLSEAQVRMIKEHMNLVATKVTEELQEAEQRVKQRAKSEIQENEIQSELDSSDEQERTKDPVGRMRQARESAQKCTGRLSVIEPRIFSTRIC